MKYIGAPQSGSQADSVASRNRGGQYYRNRAMPTQPNSAAQINQRARLTTNAAGWRGLTDAQRAAWTAFGNSFTVTDSLGQSRNLTGSQCYTKVNCVNQLNGDAIVAAPPALPAFVACTATAIAAAAGAATFTIAGVTTAAGTKHMIYGSPQRSAGVSFENDFRWLQTSSTYTAGSLDIKPAYVAKFGALIAAKKIFIKVVQAQAAMQDNGTLFSAIVAA